MSVTLGDLGERRILSEIVPQYAMGVGDDCAIIGSLPGHVVVTADPVPPPAAGILGGDDDLYWLGWLLVTINASDIAASGARPAAFVAALDLPIEMKVPLFERLLSGIRDSCVANRLRYVGGNLREASRISAVGTAIGSSIRRPLTRNGASPGDLVVVLGVGGGFWADVERIRVGRTVTKAASPVFAPVSQAPYVSALHERGFLVCAMDTSDGLAPTLTELSRTNDLGIDIDVSKMSRLHRDISESPERFWMGWGDWTVVGAVRSGDLRVVSDLYHDIGGEITVIGEFCDRKAVTLHSGTSNISLGRLESERFAPDSWFKLGVEEYRRQLLSFQMP